MIKITKLNGIDVNLLATDGGVITSNYNETLDNGTIRIPHLQNKIDIRPFYNVKLEYANKTKYMCVDSYTCTEDNIDSGFKTYTYEIKLFSEVKKLERIILPNLSITPHKIGSKLKIIDYIKQYLDEYAPKHIVSGSVVDSKTVVNRFSFIADGVGSEYTFQVQANGYTPTDATIRKIICQSGVDNYEIEVVSVVDDVITYVIRCDADGVVFGEYSLYLTKTGYDTKHLENDYTLSYRTMQKFQNEVVEMQWNNPTLKDVLNDLMMLQDCVLTMNNNVIDFLDLTEKKNPITQYNYIQEQQSSDDFETDLRMELQNVLQTRTGVDNTVKMCERIMFTTDNYVITSDNYYLETKYPILNIKSLKLVIIPTARTELLGYNVEPYEYDITDFVHEIQEYNTLPVDYRISPINLSFGKEEYYKTTKNLALYYTRLANRIEGFTNTNKGFWIVEKQTLQYLKAFALFHYNLEVMGSINAYNPDAFVSGANEYLSTFFNIEYETTESCVFEAGKKRANGFKSVIADNQTNAWADAFSVGRLEYQKANRLGNKMYMINQRITENVTPIEIGDFLDDKIAYQVNYQSYIDHEEVNAYCVENYIMQNYFTGIKSKVRTWVNAKEEAFKRHDLKKYYCEFSKTPKDEVLDTDIVNIGEYLLSPLGSGSMVKHALITSENTKNWYINDLLKRWVGNSLVFTTGFNDNGYAGKYIDLDAIHTQETEPIAKGSILPDTSADFSNKNESPNIKYASLKTAMGGIPMNVYNYTDENFETSNFRIRFIDGVNDLTENDSREIFKNAFKRPLIDDDEIGNTLLETTFEIHKDNKEIPMFSVQYEFCTDTNDIDFYESWLKYQKSISSLSGTVSIRDSSGITGLTYTLSENENYGLITINGTIEQNKDYYFYVGNEKVLRFRNTNSIYLNIRRSR